MTLGKTSKATAAEGGIMTRTATDPPATETKEATFELMPGGAWRMMVLGRD